MNMEQLKARATIFLPPMSVYLRKGKGLHFRVNIFLTVLGYVPGLVHAIWIVFHSGEPTGTVNPSAATDSSAA